MVRMRQLAACWIVIPILSLAWSLHAAWQAPGTGQTGVLEGAVLSAATNEPIPNAQVKAVRQGVVAGAKPQSLSATTDASGHFAITGLNPGQYRLQAEGKHFAMQHYGADQPYASGKVVMLGPGEHISSLDFRLLPCGAITGVVRDDNDKPVVGATVRALSVREANQFLSDATNRQGEYRIPDLEPGPYVVQVTYSAPGSPEERPVPVLSRERVGLDDSRPGSPSEKKPPPHDVYVPTYYPNTTDPGSAGFVTVLSGTATPDIDFQFSPVHAVTVSGQLVNEVTGKPVTSGSVSLDPRRVLPAGDNLAITLYSNTTIQVKDPAGKFEFPAVAPGSYWVNGQIWNPRTTLQGRVPIEVGDTDVSGVVVQIGPGVQLTGQVHVESGAAFNFSRLRVFLGLEDLPILGQSARPRTDGSFVLNGVAMATYRLKVSGLPPGYYVKSAQLGGADVLEPGVSLDSGTEGPLDIALGYPGGAITGVVRDDGHPVSATVYLVPDPPRPNRRDLYLAATARLDGMFTLKGIPPGDYKLIALRDPDPSLISNPELLQPYEANGESVSVDDGSSQSIQLELSSPAG